MKQVLTMLLSMFFIVDVCAQTSSATQIQQPGQSESKTTINQNLINQINQILDTGSGSIPEMRAQALLVLAESNMIQDEKYKMKLIRQAFRVARLTSNPLMMAYSGNFLSNDRSIVGWNTYSYRLHLDSLSLQTRAVEDAYQFNPTAAHKMLEEIEIPNMPPVECSSAVVYEPKPYYELLSIFIGDKTAYTDEERSAFADRLNESVSHLQTHTQILPIIQLLNDKRLTIRQQQDLAQSFITHLPALSGDERGFASLMTKQNLTAQIKQLYMKLKNNDPASANNLLYMWREYLVTNMKAGGCGATWLFPKTQQGDRLLITPMQDFNQEFKTELLNSGLGPIQINELGQQSAEVTIDLQGFYEDPVAKKLFDQAYKLRFQEDGNRAQLSALNSSEWQARFTLYLTSVDNWSADPMNSDKTYCAKINLYNYAIDLAPQDDLRWLAIEDSLNLIENSKVQTDKPLLWMWAIWTLQSVANHQSNGEKYTLRPDHDFTNRLIRSGDPTLRLIGRLKKAGLDPFKGGPSA